VTRATATGRPTDTPLNSPVSAAGLAMVARQPIYSASLTVIGYELLYGPADSSGETAADAAETALRVLADAAVEIGLDRLAGGLPVYIHYPRELLVAREPLSLHPERIIIQVVEELPGDAELVDAIRALRARGHRIALDHYSPELSNAALLEVVDLVKIDVSEYPPAELARLAPELIRRGLRLVAKEVETIEQFEHYLQWGYDGFQGDFLQQPQTFRAQRVPASRLATARLIAALQSADYSIEDIEQLVAQDLSIAYRVLRCINSSYYNLPRKIESIRQAIVMLGMDNLRQLCTLVILQSLDSRPASLFVTAMARARLCEQLARLAGVKDTGPYFITGLFSLLDVLTGIPMPQLLDQLPLAEPIERALLGLEGDLGAALACARAYERGFWARVSYHRLPAELIRAAYVDAVFWAEEAQALTSR
jgi:c-di-GMP phosphodiesterase